MTEQSLRTLLTGIATASTIAIAGCAGSDPETPEEVTEAEYIAAYNPYSL